MRLTRRNVVRFAAGTVATAGLGALSGAPAVAESVIKIGIELQKGMELYAKTHQDDLPAGVGISLITRDDTSSPEVGKRLAQELIAREKVNILLGVIGSPIAAAMAPLTAEAKIPLILANAAGVAIPRISPYVARVSFTQCRPLCR
jgi:branched-chain amino acid transport system substrate-binding protein